MSKAMTAPAPGDIGGELFETLKGKATLGGGPMIMLGVMAGVYIGLGGLFAIVALAGAQDLPYGVGQLMAGAVFALGLVLVLIAGAELFTGNMLFAGPVATGQVSLGQAARALGIVYVANFVGSLLLAAVVLMANVHEAGDGAVGRAALLLAEGKVDNPALSMFASGLLANMLVCLAVWMAAAGRTVSQKIAGLLLPVAAFVAMGLEHSIANMYLLPYRWMVQTAAGESNGVLSLVSIMGNLVPVTLGNMLGGALIALAYWYAYVRQASPGRN